MSHTTTLVAYAVVTVAVLGAGYYVYQSGAKKKAHAVAGARRGSYRGDLSNPRKAADDAARGAKILGTAGPAGVVAEEVYGWL